jgi:HSP20 family molecular chaperone IbpA
VEIFSIYLECSFVLYIVSAHIRLHQIYFTSDRVKNVKEEIISIKSEMKSLRLLSEFNRIMRMRAFPTVFDIFDAFEAPRAAIPTFYRGAGIPMIVFEEKPVERIAKQAAKTSMQTERNNAAAAQIEPKDFSVSCNVSTFKPEEISVKIIDRDIIVEGQHEERQDEFGFVSRKFMRKYTLPEEYDPDTVATFMSADGQLTVKAVRARPAFEQKERVIPIKRVTDEGEEELISSKKKKDTDGSEETCPKGTSDKSQ